MEKKNKYYNEYVLTEQLPLNSSNRDEVLKWIYDIHIVEWYTTYLLHKRVDDLDTQDKIGDIYLMIAEKPQSVWDDLFEQGKYAISAYVAGIIHHQIVSDNSAVYKRYEKYKKTEITQDDLFWENYGENN